ncbi:MAG: hypothetical protein ACREDM_13525 [Methylocella sp.]
MTSFDAGGSASFPSAVQEVALRAWVGATPPRSGPHPEAAARSYLTFHMPWCIATLDAPTALKAFVVQDEARLAWRDALLAASALIAGLASFLSPRTCRTAR